VRHARGAAPGDVAPVASLCAAQSRGPGTGQPCTTCMAPSVTRCRPRADRMTWPRCGPRCWPHAVQRLPRPRVPCLLRIQRRLQARRRDRGEEEAVGLNSRVASAAVRAASRLRATIGMGTVTHVAPPSCPRAAPAHRRRSAWYADAGSAPVQVLPNGGRTRPSYRRSGLAEAPARVGPRMSRWWEHSGVPHRRAHGGHRDGARSWPYAYVRPS
jgi:hypothetical protein